jgi:uncharacterized protein (TIGR02266 family)
MAEQKKRQHPRVQVDVAVKVRSGGEAWASGQIKNLSLGGVFIASDRLLPFGAEPELEFVLPGSPTIRCKGLVIWTTKQYPERAGGLSGMGLRLIGLSLADMRRIDELVRERLDNQGAA